MPMYMMHMSFYQTSELTLLIKGLASEEGEAGKYVALLAVVFIIAFILEMLNYMRYHLLNQSMGEKYGEKIATIPIPRRLMITALYML